MDSPWPDVKDLCKDVYVEESYPTKVLETDKKNAREAMEATAAFEDAMKTIQGKTKREKTAKSKTKVRADYGMEILLMKEAIIEAQAEEMRRDERVIIEGEDVGLYGGAYGATKGLILSLIHI